MRYSMMNFDKNQFKHVTVALNTPFTKDEDIDLDATKKVVRYFKQKGIKSLYVCGSTGEGFLLDDTERMKVVEAACEEACSDMNIIVHVGTASTRRSAQLAKHAQSAGADAVSAVPCVYYHLGEESVYRHWTGITEASDLPFFIYNIPQLTSFNLSMPLFNRMLENEKVCGVKCSSDPAHDIMRFKQAGGDNFIVFNGPDEQYLAGRIMGADAGIGGTYGAMPELYLKLDQLIEQKEFEKAQKVQGIITPLVYRLCGFASLYGAVKTILAMDGCNIGGPRLPFLPVPENTEGIRELYEDIQAAITQVKAL